MTENQSTTFSRRQILAGLAGAGVVTVIGTSPVAGAMKALVAPAAENNAVIVNVFLRGAADGLNIVVPHGDDNYYNLRSSIAQPKNTLSDLDGFFGLHQAFAPLHPLYQQGEMAFIHAAGSHHITRSHFTAMDNMDLAFGNTGWMQRVLASELAADPVSAISIGARTSPSLRGRYGGLAFPRLNQFRNGANQMAPMRSTLEAMYQGADPLTSSATIGAFASIDTLSGVDTTPDVAYPNNSSARDLREAAALIKADIGVRMVSVNIGGWDHHSDEEARMQTKGSQLAGALAAFKADLGAASGRVLTIVMSEFGRTAAQNGSGGTDHGHGNMMMLMGGGLAAAGGGKVHLANDQWVGLSEGELYQKRDLAITTDFRSVLAEALDGHLGFNDLGSVFPGFTPDYLGFLNPAGPPPDPGPDPTDPPAPPTTAPITTTTMLSTTTGPSTTQPGPSTTQPDPGPSTTQPGPPTTQPTTTTTSPPPPGGDGQVTGSVLYTGGGGAANIVIDLFKADAAGQRGQWIGDTRSDSSGNYAFTVPAGTYVLTFIAPSGGSFVGGRDYAQPSVTIAAGQTVTGINAQLVSGGADDASIGGSVTDGAGGVGGITVDLFIANGDGSRGLWLGDTKSDASGRYSFGVQPGCYVLTFIAPADRRFDNGGPYYQPALCVDAKQQVSDVNAKLQ